MAIFSDKKSLPQVQFSSESEFEKEVFSNCRMFFGEKTILLDTKKLLQGAVKSTIPDGYLFDFSDSSEATIYMIEVETESHDFYSHIVPQITKFLGIYRTQESRNKLASVIYSIIDLDKEINKIFSNFLGKKEIYKSLLDMINERNKILLIMDSEKHKNAFEEMVEIYAEWGKTVERAVIKKFTDGEQTIYDMKPAWEGLEYSDEEKEEKVSGFEGEEIKLSKYDESLHTYGIHEETFEIYQLLKSEIKKINSEIFFAPKKNYINVATNKKPIVHIWIRKSKLRLTLFTSEDEAKKYLEPKNFPNIKSPSEKAINWHGTTVCNLSVTNKGIIAEAISILKYIIDKDKKRYG